MVSGISIPLFCTKQLEVDAPQTQQCMVHAGPDEGMKGEKLGLSLTTCSLGTK